MLNCLIERGKVRLENPLDRCVCPFNTCKAIVLNFQLFWCVLKLAMIEYQSQHFGTIQGTFQENMIPEATSSHPSAGQNAFLVGIITIIGNAC